MNGLMKPERKRDKHLLYEIIEMQIFHSTVLNQHTIEYTKYDGK